MGIILIFIYLLVLFNGAYAPPPNRQAAEQAAKPPPQEDENAKPMYQFAYSRYLETVVKILENDPKFTEKLRGLSEDELKTGKVADHIDDLHPGIFDELTKAKIAEVERLREEIGKQIEKDGGAHNIKVPDHLDVQNWEKFNKEDLRKLIVRTVADMEEVDRQRKVDFKEYELKKKAEEDHKLAQLTPEERQKAEQEVKAADARHNDHEKLKHPGARDQLEEVWEESDHMDKDNYDPRTFFNLHDLNGDGYWNDDEIEALFRIEIDKVYNETDPDDDPRERVEEMYRMREHVVGQMDKNNDRLISLEEFLADNEAQKPVQEDEGWKDLANQDLYTEEELKQFEAEYAKKQGWGDGAYEQATTAQNNLGDQPHAQPVQVQPHQQQEQQVLPAQPQAQPVQQEAVPQNIPHQEEKKAFDPGYGI